MLRLDLNDKNETVFFVNPMKGVNIYKQKDLEDKPCILLIDTGDIVCYLAYESEKSRNADYEHVLTKIHNYLFPQIETTQLRCKEE
jgi:hypothetical protein